LNAGRRAPETTVVLSLGSNLGAREEHILAGVSMLGRVGGLRILALSSLYETSPVGISTDRSFINAACIARCALPARDLLAGCREIERGRGRSAGAGASRDRTLDIDIVLYGDEIIEERGLSIPHPRFEERLFVLLPLMEICPRAAVPPAGRSIADIFAKCRGEGWARRVSGRIDPLNFLKTK
jgi:2-amino-4-hydroxy-6-hydroxymethyldihydropteridine diphosphokinase